jgi:hypothetical protein
VSDVYAYWRTCVAAGCKRPEEAVPLMLATVGAAIPGENPQCGLWKVRPRKGEPHVLMQVWLVDDAERPVTSWREGLQLRGMVDASHASPQELAERWLFAMPVTKDDATHWREHGRWPGDAPPLAGALPPKTHNQPTDPYALILGEAHERIAQAKARLGLPIADQTACDMARNLQAELLALEKRADGMYETEVRPHIDATTAVRRRYDFRALLAEWSAKLRSAFGGWMAAEEARQRAEADARYAAERAIAEAERARIETERARQIADDPIAALTSPKPQLPPLPAAPEAVKVQSGGGTGRKAGLKTTWDIQITDYKLAALHVIEHPEVSIVVGKVLTKLVRAAKGRADIPGVKVVERREVA